MLNSILENRIQRDGLYHVILQIPEDEYFNTYEGLTKEAAGEILHNYLSYHGDDGNPEKITIDQNKDTHVVNIKAELHYIGNEHTEAWRTPDTLNLTRDNIKHK